MTITYLEEGQMYFAFIPGSCENMNERFGQHTELYNLTDVILFRGEGRYDEWRGKINAIETIYASAQTHTHTGHILD